MDFLSINLYFAKIEVSLLLCILLLYMTLQLVVSLTWRKPLYFNMFLVEMHSWRDRRLVQVVHLGQEYLLSISWERFLSRMRARAPRVPNEERIAISDTNIVIQSPSTVIEAADQLTLDLTVHRAPDADRITFWDIEMPPRPEGEIPNSARDSQFAAAAAIAILARGNDVHLRPRFFHNDLDPSAADVPSSSTRNMPRFISEQPVTVRTTIQPEISGPGYVEARARRRSRGFASGGIRAPSVPVRTTPPNIGRTSSRFSTSAGPPPPRSSELVAIPDAVSVPSSSSSFDIPSSSASSDIQSSSSSANVEVVENSIEESEVGEESGEKVLIRLKFMDDTEKETHVFLSDTLGKYKREQCGAAENDVVRLIHRGLLLRDDSKTLASYGIQTGSIIHCHISTTPYARPSNPVVLSPSDVVAENNQATLPPRVPRTRRNMNLQLGRQTFRQFLNTGPTSGGRFFSNLLFLTIMPTVVAMFTEILRARRHWVQGNITFSTLALTTYQRLYNTVVNFGNLDENYVPDPNAPTLFDEQPSTESLVRLTLHMCLFTILIFMFTMVLDRVAVTLMVIIILVFLLFSYQNIIEPEIDRRFFRVEVPMNG